jgi:hypothetical protein
MKLHVAEQIFVNAILAFVHHVPAFPSVRIAVNATRPHAAEQIYVNAIHVHVVYAPIARNAADARKQFVAASRNVFAICASAVPIAGTCSVKFAAAVRYARAPAAARPATRAHVRRTLRKTLPPLIT